MQELAEFMIRATKEEGFQLVTLGECLGDDKENWYRNLYDGDSWRRSPVEGGHDVHDKKERPFRILEVEDLIEAEGRCLHNHSALSPRTTTEVPNGPHIFPPEMAQKPLVGTSDIWHGTNTKHDEQNGPKSENRCVVNHDFICLPEIGSNHVQEGNVTDSGKPIGPTAGASELRVPLSTAGILVALSALFLYM